MSSINARTKNKNFLIFLIFYFKKIFMKQNFKENPSSAENNCIKSSQKKDSLLNTQTRKTKTMKGNERKNRKAFLYSSTGSLSQEKGRKIENTNSNSLLLTVVGKHISWHILLCNFKKVLKKIIEKSVEKFNLKKVF